MAVTSERVKRPGTCVGSSRHTNSPTPIAVTSLQRSWMQPFEILSIVITSSRCPGCGGRARWRLPMEPSSTCMRKICSQNITSTTGDTAALPTITFPIPTLPSSPTLSPVGVGGRVYPGWPLEKYLGHSAGHAACRYSRTSDPGLCARLSTGNQADAAHPQLERAGVLSTESRLTLPTPGHALPRRH